MEKLQVAINKARMQRNKVSQTKSSSEPLEAPKKLTHEKSQKRWEGLTPITVSERTLNHNRLVASAVDTSVKPFDMLRTRILQQARANGWKRIALVSPHSSCGKSTMAANLAFSFGRQSDLRTMILDLDLRRGGLLKILDQSCQYSMADVLEGKISFLEHGRRLGTNVALGLNGKCVKNASEILQSGKTTEILDLIDAEFKQDIVLFDMPPLMEVDDNFGFLKNADCALLVAEAGRTTADQVDVAERQLAELTNVMGVVLNKSHYTQGAYGYGYGYE
ncbi:CpsD/CapB family tyrosine-protein kinase [Ruegeria sp. AU67]|uniref:CpsD/CapB family tyrosine-protein kinase n=1 Tax=Ruegeria sp. AU67 TaxID=2108530 RepID=UPI000D693B96|nr:CpsD/CapB family tyrosine-protein kinase [Ruegeria sp. AU67]